MKTILLWLSAGILSFVLLIVIIFGVLFFLEPEDPMFEQRMIAGDDFFQDTFVQKKQVEIDSLSVQINELNSQLFFRDLKEDSLNQVIRFQEGLVTEYKTSLERSNEAMKQKDKVMTNLKGIAKTYEGLKVNEMRPIFDKLDDKTVIGIYENMSARNRKNIMKALPANRAAAITQYMAQGG